MPDSGLYDALIQSLERALRALGRLYEDCSDCISNLQSELMLSDISMSDTQLQVSPPLNNNKMTIVDMELDVNEDTKNMDMLTVSGKFASGISYSAVKWKLNIISMISIFFSVLHVVTWDILFELIDKECSQEVREKILYDLCQHAYWSCSAKITDLVNLIDNMTKMQVSLKLNFVNILTAVHSLLGTMLLFDAFGKGNYASQLLRERVSE